MNEKALIVLAAGGTGGHLFPAEAVAWELLEQGFNVAITTDKRGKNFSDLAKHPHLNIIRFSGGGIASGSLFSKIKGALSLMAGSWQAYHWFKKNKPTIAVGFGGFASVPPLWAAKYTRTPYIIHEQNAVLGRANQILSKHARQIMSGFKNVKKCPPETTPVWVGTPVRDAFLQEPIRNYHKTKKFNLLVIGGSQGAHFFTQLIPQAIALLPETLQKYIFITQQVRKEDTSEAKTLWKKTNAQYELSPFFKDISEKMLHAHLYIGRAGASSLSECLAVGLPAIMIPYPHAVDDHQYFNAINLEHQGCGWVVREHEIRPEQLAHYLKMLVFQPERLSTASQAAEQNAKRDATKQIVKIILQYI